MDELALPQGFTGATDYRVAERTLRDHGWTSCGAGDWAIALSTPSGLYVARISPFDPAAPHNAELYRRAAPTGQVPRLHGEVELEGGAHLMVLERLHPVADVGRAEAFHRAIAASSPGVAELAALVAAVHEEARRALPWCGPVDTNPTNVMETVDGRLVLIDPYFADGPNLFGTILTDPARVAASIPPHLRRHLFDLPGAGTGPFDPDVLLRMRRSLAAADAAAEAGGRPPPTHPVDRRTTPDS